MSLVLRELFPTDMGIQAKLFNYWRRSGYPQMLDFFTKKHIAGVDFFGKQRNYIKLCFKSRAAMEECLAMHIQITRIKPMRLNYYRGENCVDKFTRVITAALKDSKCTD